MSMHTRSLGMVRLTLFAAVAAACSSGGGDATPTSTTTASSTSGAVTTTLASGTPTTTTPPVDTSTAVWPTAASPDRYHDPVAAARSFATRYLHFGSPVVGPFQSGDARSGEVTIRRSARGPATTVLVRRLGGDSSWWVLGATTPNIEIAEPAALATITSPVRLRGMSTAFEGTVQVSIRQDDGPELADGFVTGGGNGDVGPFDGTFRFAQPRSPDGAVVLFTISPEDGTISEATVIRVHLAPA